MDFAPKAQPSPEYALYEKYKDGETHMLRQGVDPPPTVIDGPQKLARIDIGIPYPVHLGIPKDHYSTKHKRSFRYVPISDRGRWPIKHLKEGESYPIPASLKTTVGVYGPMHRMKLSASADPESWEFNRNRPMQERAYRVWRLPDDATTSRGRPSKVEEVILSIDAHQASLAAKHTEEPAQPRGPHAELPGIIEEFRKKEVGVPFKHRVLWNRPAYREKIAEATGMTFELTHHDQGVGTYVRRT